MFDIHVVLTDERGNSIEDLGDLGGELFRAMPHRDDVDYPYLRFVDPYDTTAFTQLQMAALIPDLRRLARARPSRAVDRVLELAEVCEATVHSRLVFIGD
jgi:hypothetical protein